MRSVSTENTDSKASKAATGGAAAPGSSSKTGTRRAAAPKVPAGTRGSRSPSRAQSGGDEPSGGSRAPTGHEKGVPAAGAELAPRSTLPPVQPTVMMQAGGAAPAVAALGRQETLDLLRRNLKVLLFHLASHSESPGRELEAMLQEVIFELYSEAQEALALKKSHLKLIKS